MRADTAPTASEQQYSRAHAAQYGQGDPLGAVRTCGQVIAPCPGTAEAGYSQTQILALVNQVVPAGEQLAAHTALILRHLQPDGDRPASPDRP